MLQLTKKEEKTDNKIKKKKIKEIDLPSYGLLNYVNRHKRGSFSKGFTEIDFLIFSCLSYLKFDYIRPNLKEIFNLTSVELKLITPEHTTPFTALVCKMYESIKNAPKYKSIKVIDYKSYFSSENNTQFFGIAYLIDSSNIIVAFRGTDSTVVGWREDLALCYEGMNSHKHAHDFLENLIKKFTSQDIYVVGHSKGGNLALYSYLMLDTPLVPRIKQVYLYDNPGVNPNHLDIVENYKNRLHKINSYIPTESVIGVLLLRLEARLIVRSSEKSLAQHNPFTWKIEKNQFIREFQLNEKYLRFESAINNWLKTMTDEEKRTLFTTLFDIYEESRSKKENKDYLGNLSILKSVAILAKINSLPKSERMLIVNFLKEFLKFSMKEKLNIKPLNAIVSFLDMFKKNNDDSDETIELLEEESNAI